MERRHFVFQPQMSDLGPDYMWNDQHPAHQMNLADGSSVVPSHSLSFQNPSVPYACTAMRRVGDILLPNYSSRSMSYMANNTETYDSYVYPPSSSSSRLPPYYVQSGPCYNQATVSNCTAMSNPQLDYIRATYKRKTPSVSDSERGTLSGYYCAGSSSRLPFEDGYLEPKPVVGHGYWTMNPAYSECSYRGNELFSSEGASQRNVRRRHGNAFHHEMTTAGAQSFSYMPHHLPSAINTVNPTASGQWNHSSPSLDHHRISNSLDLAFHPNSGSYDPNVGMRDIGLNQPNAVFGRTFCYPLPYPCDTAAQSSAEVHSSSDQRTTYRTPLNYPASTFTINTQDFMVPAGATAMPPWYWRNLSISGHANESSRARNQLQMLTNAGDATSRWAYGDATFNQTSLYGSMNYFDQHSDLRLDIDSISYEELLALGERIGNVNTGLNDVAMSRCLVESIYCSSDLIPDDQDNENCAICLESYEDRECLAKLNCRHEFHAVCIRKWLSIKNACPVCKVSASED